MALQHPEQSVSQHQVQLEKRRVLAWGEIDGGM